MGIRLGSRDWALLVSPELGSEDTKRGLPECGELWQYKNASLWLVTDISTWTPEILKRQAFPNKK